jgi:hypothetical protein
MPLLPPQRSRVPEGHAPFLSACGPGGAHRHPERPAWRCSAACHRPAPRTSNRMGCPLPPGPSLDNHHHAQGPNRADTGGQPGACLAIGSLDGHTRPRPGLGRDPGSGWSSSELEHLQPEAGRSSPLAPTRPAAEPLKPGPALGSTSRNGRSPDHSATANTEPAIARRCSSSYPQRARNS